MVKKTMVMLPRAALISAWSICFIACGEILNTDGHESASEVPASSDDSGVPTGDDVTDGSPAVVTCIDDTASIPDGFLGVAYSFTLSASAENAPYLWYATGLPAGLTLTQDINNSTTAVLEGTPTKT